MAIVTGDLYKGFTFGDISSKDYGVYITQEASYNAPERDIETIEIAGRNGAYIRDKGRFLNIEVSYKCGIALDNEDSFESAVRAFRNALSSKSGKYVRLEDDYNPDEYREAAFVGGISVTMADKRAGEFTVTFDCKPQRWLKSGEVLYTVSSGNTYTNPTLFASHPLLKIRATGDATITFGDSRVSIVDALVGRIPLNLTKTSQESSSGFTDSLTISNTSTYASGDPITFDGFDMTVKFDMRLEVSSASFTNVSGLITSVIRAGGHLISARLRSDTLSFVAGTASTVTLTATLNASYRGAGTETLAIPVTVAYNGNSRITVSVSVGSFASGSTVSVSNSSSYNGTVNSSVNTLTEPIFLDCETGNAWSIIGDAVVSMNNHVFFGAELPSIPTGSFSFGYSGVRLLSVAFRWWEV